MRADLQPNNILNDRYRILNLLGEGGMGQVYVAIDNNRDCVVAIKQRGTGRERLRDAAKLRKKFEHEAKLLSNLVHPTLPRVIHHFFEGDEQFLVMDFIEGDDLEELLRKRGYHPFSVDEVLGWADKLLETLEYLHNRPEPIIHRDIKPQNIKITPEGYVYLLDFGLAKGAAGQMSTLETDPYSMFGGTRAFAPLEQLNGSPTNQQSDLYSLGATFYRLLTGSNLILASMRNEAIESRQSDPLPPAHQINSDVPLYLSGVISHAMSISRKDRIASATDMRRALTEVRFEITAERARQVEIRRREQAEEERRRAQEEEARRLVSERERQRAETERLRSEALLHQREEDRRRSAAETLRQNVGPPEVVNQGPVIDQSEEEIPQPKVLSMGPYILWFSFLYLGIHSLLIFATWLLGRSDIQLPQGVNIGLYIAVLYAAGISTSSRFAKRHSRFFTKDERIRLISYSFILVLFVQTAFVLMAAQSLFLPVLVWVVILVFTIIVNLLLMMAAFGSVSNNIVNNALARKEGTLAPRKPMRKIWRVLLIGLVVLLLIAVIVDISRYASRQDSAYESYKLGHTYYAQQQYPAAIVRLQQAVKLNPALPEARYYLGMAYLKMNNRQEAMRQYDALKSLNPKWAESLAHEMSK